MYMYLDFSGETVKDKKADKQPSFKLQKTNKRQSCARQSPPVAAPTSGGDHSGKWPEKL